MTDLTSKAKSIVHLFMGHRLDDREPAVRAIVQALQEYGQEMYEEGYKQGCYDEAMDREKAKPSDITEAKE